MPLETGHARSGPTVAPDWKAVGFQSKGGPLVLVEFEGMRDRTVRSRLDIAKMTLLDPLPFKPANGALGKLVEWITTSLAQEQFA
jgi:hypothetical protein